MDNFDVTKWNRDRYSAEDDKSKAKDEEHKIGDNLYKKVTGEDPKVSTKNKIRDVVKELFKTQNEVKINTPPKTYVVGYYEYYNDSWEGDYIEVEASSEEQAIEKAKEQLPRATKGFKAKLK
jgi:hypothetical protein